MPQFKSIYCLLIILCAFTFSCKTEKKEAKETTNPFPVTTENTVSTIANAKGFTIEKLGDITLIKVLSPWPDADKNYTYALIPREKAATITLDRDAYDAIVLTPVERIVVTSTTHIPMLEMLGVESTLVGFPDTNYISSEKTRALIDAEKVKDLGQNDQINIELLIDLQPELVIGFSINNTNPTYKTIQKANIPVVYNGDWTEATPIGRAEWIRFFAPFFHKEAKATEVFNTIKQNYNEAKKLAQQATTKPTVLSGAMYKDIWYLPAGDSFQAQFLKDANADYLWKDSEGTGSLSLSIESVLDKAADAEIWIGPGRFKTYEDLKKASELYAKFDPFKHKKVFTIGNTIGETGGTIYYELAPTRPDIVLKDLIKAIHPDLLPTYEPYFFKPVN
ncbi:ABC transporter substrate-binding protein [Kordia sp. YSTF-M3]|uniref:ABC transporter substrate-binding protein n=1 Tax=Kordia aestuariivivens TaxID=2759037 RepID=A0ABR7QE44_9FLAO|nr:ABC transporter substrate-binding protein [Kordia aestuariivivens]MBC8756835.1 ABC transporter substrate-binding protein [Kordia aestuariivivens]